MKNTILAASIAVVAAGTSSIALANGSLGFAPGDLLEHNQGRLHGTTSGGALYGLTGGGTSVPPNNGGATTTLYSTVDTTGNLWNTTITCTGLPTDPSGNPTPYAPDRIVTELAFPWSVAAGGSIGAVGGIPPKACAVNMGDRGQITGGWQLAFPFNGGAAIVNTIFLYDAPRVMVTTTGATCPDGGAGAVGNDAIAHAIDARDTLFDQLAQGNTLVGGQLDGLMTNPSPAGCLVNGITRVSIGQCDPTIDTIDCVNTVAKAVPVPAFAAGALALGVAGVTYLTSRRRSIK